ncbi:MAG: hypothetical protein SGI92_24765 [Bryobacteraceae bacterium]|nr:hypothetical protein [Bryobacteraceae bacterium]
MSLPAASVQDYRHAEITHPKTHFTPPTWASRSDWVRHRFHLQRQILGAAGAHADAPPPSV